MVLDLLVEDSSGLLIKLGGDVVTVDESLTLVEPLPYLTEVPREAGVQEPLPVPDLGFDFLPLGFEAGRRLLVVFSFEALGYSEVVT